MESNFSSAAVSASLPHHSHTVSVSPFQQVVLPHSAHWKNPFAPQ